MKTLKKIYKLVKENKSNSITFFIILMVFSSVLETMSIALLVPLISSIINESSNSIIQSSINSFILYFTEIFNFQFDNKKDLIFPILILFSFIVTLKVFVVLFFTNLQSEFKFNLINNIAKKIFSYYLNKPYNFFVKNNSSILIRNSSAEIDICANSAVRILTLINEIFLFMFILSFLFFFNLKVTLFFIIVFSFSGGIFILLTKKKMFKLAKDRQLFQGKTFQYAREAFGAIKEVIIYKKFNFFLHQYLDSYKKITLVNWSRDVLQVIPKHLLEYLMFISIFFFIYISQSSFGKIDNIFTTLTIFAAAGYKLLPGFNRIITTIQQIKLSKPAIDIIYEETLGFKKDKQESKAILKNLNFEKSFEFKKISFSYEKDKKILDNLNFSFKKGETIGIFGPSGGGKSTLMDLITGVYQINSGEIFIDEKKIDKLNSAWSANIGYVPQFTYIFDGSFEKNIAFGIPEHEIDKIKLRSAIVNSGLEDLINSFNDKQLKVIGEKGASLSGGQRQRIGIARSLYLDPDIIILDESLNALDLLTENKIIESIKKLNKTLIIISHRKSTLEKCQKIFKVENKKINILSND